MELENYTLSSPGAFSAWLSWGNRIPGALPQARVELRAFGAKTYKIPSIGFVANTHVDIPRTRLIYSLL